MNKMAEHYINVPFEKWLCGVWALPYSSFGRVLALPTIYKV